MRLSTTHERTMLRVSGRAGRMAMANAEWLAVQRMHGRASEDEGMEARQVARKCGFE